VLTSGDKWGILAAANLAGGVPPAASSPVRTFEGGAAELAFRGSFEFTLDAKNRLTIPVKFRGPFVDGVTLARMRDVTDCVSVWCTPVFDAYVESLIASCHPLSEEREALARFYGANSQDAELDAAGRVIVPPRMLATAGIEKDVVVNGVANRLEVWARDTWNKVNAELTEAVKEIRPALGTIA
jgi:MraZ protein